MLEFLCTDAGPGRPLDPARGGAVRVMIAGGGSVGTAIALDLVDRHHDVTLFEQVTATAERLKVLLPGVNVVAADACEYNNLAAADLRSVDVVIAATGDDEDNLVVSWLAKQEFGVPRVISRINNSRNEWLFNESWGVDVSVSTPSLITSLVDEAVEVGALVKLMDLAHGRVKLIEVTLASDSPPVAQGLTLDDLRLPDAVRVVSVVRGDQSDGADQHDAVPGARPRHPDGARGRDPGLRRRVHRLAAEDPRATADLASSRARGVLRSRQDRHRQVLDRGPGPGVPRPRPAAPAHPGLGADQPDDVPALRRRRRPHGQDPRAHAQGHQGLGPRRGARVGRRAPSTRSSSR